MKRVNSRMAEVWTVDSKGNKIPLPSCFTPKSTECERCEHKSDCGNYGRTGR